MFFFESFHSGSKQARAAISAWTIGSALCLASVTAAEDCRFQGSIAALDSRQGVIEQTHGADCFEVSIQQTGWALVFATGESPVRLDVTGLYGSTPQILRQSPDSVFFAVEPGTYRLRLASMAPWEAVGAYGLRSAFVPVSESRPPVHKSAEEEEDDDGIEIVIDPFAAPCDPTARAEEGEDDDGIEIVIDPFADPCGGEALRGAHGQVREQVLSRLCSTLTDDDHGDTLLCASIALMGDTAYGHVDGLDKDLFFFALEERGTVIVQAPGAVATLLDEHGQNLGAPQSRLAKTLVPGHYFVEVRSSAQSDKGSGMYELTMSLE